MSATCSGTTRQNQPCQNTVANPGGVCGRCKGPTGAASVDDRAAAVMDRFDDGAAAGLTPEVNYRGDEVFVEATGRAPLGEGRTLTTWVSLLRPPKNERPYFSVSASIVERETGERRAVTDDSIVQVWPEMEAATRVHLADDRGWPMRAVGDSVHWAGGTMFRPESSVEGCDVVTDELGSWNPVMLSSHLRVSEDEAAEIRKRAFAHPDGVEAGFEVECERLSDRWLRDAEDAVAAIEAFEGR